MTAILGGGIGGLSAAHYALESPKLRSLILLEASDHLGGWVRSEKSKSGAVFEKGPRTVRPTGDAGKNTLRLIDELDLTDKIIPISRTHPSSKNRLIYAEKKLHLLPSSLSSLFKVNPPFKRPLITAMLNDMTAPKGPSEDQNMYSFVQRRFGIDVAEYLISPMLCGICAGSAKQISVNFLMKKLFELEQKHGGVCRGVVREGFKSIFANKNQSSKNAETSRSVERAVKERWAVWGLRDGLEQLPKKLQQSLKQRDVKICTNTRVDSVTFQPDFVELEIGGRTERCERVISSLSAGNLGKILERQHPELSRELCAIPTVTVAVVNFEFPGKVLPMEAFGFLVPPREKIPILGVIFDSCVFPNESTVLTVMMGGAWWDQYFGANSSTEYLESTALEQLRSILGIRVDPLDINCKILKDCIPQYIVSHEDRIARIRSYIDSHKLPLAICGSSYSGVGINDVILSAKQAVCDVS